MEKDLVDSYTSASGNFPIKVLKNNNLINNIIKYKKIIPIHIQLNLTNKCNLDCEWCSCSERDKSLVLNYDKINDLAYKYRDLGCEAVTITGGGEPLLYPRIDEIIKLFDMINISIGMVTNGWNIDKLSDEIWNKITWLRISLGDGRKKELESIKYWDKISHISNLDVDLSFSYVLTNDPDYSLIAKMIRFANNHNMTHIRIVTDIIERDFVNTIFDVKEFLVDQGINDSLVIYQDRTVWTKGYKKCYISLLKPVIGADGKIYPCCGSQYLDKEPARNYSGCMGDIININKIINEQQYFDGSKCEVCYYSGYNKLLDSLLLNLNHEVFV